jgi:hypothetical protein
MEFNKQTMAYWQKQLEYTRDENYPNSCRDYSVSVRPQPNVKLLARPTVPQLAAERQRRQSVARHNALRPVDWSAYRVSDHSSDE